MKTDVLVVGAGPTGLMAANQLMRFGVDFQIVDCKSGPTRESRAIGVTPRSLEIYQQLGLSDEVMANCARIQSVNAYFGGKRKARVEIGEVGIGLSEFTSLVAYEQSKNETLLTRNLTDHGHEVLWRTAFESFVEQVLIGQLQPEVARVRSSARLLGRKGFDCLLDLVYEIDDSLNLDVSHGFMKGLGAQGPLS